MNCSDLDRWLDEGAPENGRAAAMRHAGGCARCARTLEAERAVEAALRAEALRVAPSMEPSAGFVARVMAQVEGEATAQRATPAAAISAGPPRTPWWVAIATDPMSVVPVTLGISLALLGSWRPQWLADAAIGFAAQWTSLASSMNVVPSIHVNPLIWLSLGVAAAPFLAWGIVGAWRRLERTLVFLTAGRRV